MCWWLTPGKKTASLVPPSIPTAESGLYWGYRVRVADSLAQVFSECPYESDGGYDISIGTSERGTPIEDILDDLPPFRLSPVSPCSLFTFRIHLLISFLPRPISSSFG